MPVEPGITPVTEKETADPPRRYRWYQKISALLLIVFCMEIGCFLLIFPWYGDVWDRNLFSSLLQRGYWENPYFRGALSGLGVVNLYISFAEILRLRRFW